ncbi:hypothetical protein V1318_03745 [Lysobacter sp. CCNWLW3]|uniref:hypothetical protein n=1 Tax=unclassified Lysobacter TaxID=2635362 RepID=UPI002FD2071C
MPIHRREALIRDPASIAAFDRELGEQEHRQSTFFAASIRSSRTSFRIRAMPENPPAPRDMKSSENGE